MIFEYVGEISAKNNWGSVSIKFQADNNTLYVLLPKNNTFVKDVVINVYENKYAFLCCSEGRTDGAWVERNYTLNDGMVDFAAKIGENKTETINFDVYKRSL